MVLLHIFQMKEEKMLARIREAEKSQSLAELTQKISSLEFKVKQSTFVVSSDWVASSDKDIYTWHHCVTEQFEQSTFPYLIVPLPEPGTGDRG